MKENQQTVLSIIIVVALVWGASSFLKKESYTGFYYPDAGNLTNDIQSKETFSTLEACRDWVDEQKSIHNLNGLNDDYECGKNCDLSGGKPYICEETLE